VGGASYTLTYDGENRLVGVSGSATATFIYDGDGKRVKGTVDSTTTTYLGNYFEWTTSTSNMKKYYYTGGTKVGMRTGEGTGTTGLNWLLGDHLGSTAITASSAGGKLAEVRYKAWGEDRYTSGSTPTTFRFTGQRQESGIGLYFYNSRFYDSSLGRFSQPDTIVPQPGNVLAWDRYAYTLNNPVRYTDPSGHAAEQGTGGGGELARLLLKILRDSIPRISAAQTPTQQHTPLPPTLSSTPKPQNSGPLPKYSPVPIASSQTTPSPTQDTKINDNAAVIVDLAGTVAEYGDTMNWWHLPGTIGWGIDGISQLIKDSDQDLNLFQRSTRASIVALEGQLISTIALAVTAGTRGGQPVLIVTTGFVGYVASCQIMSNTADAFNNSFLFPMFGLQPN
jgi:RHS repeat-associated protein